MWITKYLSGLYLSHYKRQYNRTVYGHGRGHHFGCRSPCVGCLARRACRDSFDPISACGCFLSHTPRPHGDRLAVAGRFICSSCLYRCVCHVRSTGCRSTFFSRANSFPYIHKDSCPNLCSTSASDTDTDTHLNTDSRIGCDSSCDIDSASDSCRNCHACSNLHLHPNNISITGCESHNHIQCTDR